MSNGFDKECNQLIELLDKCMQVRDRPEQFAIALRALAHRAGEIAEEAEPQRRQSGESCAGVEGYFTADHLGRQWVCTDKACAVHRSRARS